MGYIWAIYYIYLLTYYFCFRSVTRVPVVLPGRYPGNKLPGYGSPNYSEWNAISWWNCFVRIVPHNF